MAKLVSFSAGLDSTWIMYRLLCGSLFGQASEVRAAYFSMYNGGNTNFMEMLCGVAMIGRMMDYHNAQTHHVTWTTVKEGSFTPITSGRSYDNGWSPLIQQGNIVTTMANLMCRITRRHHQALAFVGWNKYDAVENSLDRGDWTLDEYARMKHLYHELVYFQDHAGRVPPLQTPAWDKEKIDMWRELPANIQELVQVSNFNNYEFAIDRDSQKLWVYTSPCAKSTTYRKLGIAPSVGWCIRLNDAYRRFWCSQLGESVSTIELTVPKCAKFVPYNKHYPQYVVGDDDDRLQITAYSAEEWIGCQSHFERLQQIEKARLKAK